MVELFQLFCENRQHGNLWVFITTGPVKKRWQYEQDTFYIPIYIENLINDINEINEVRNDVLIEVGELLGMVLIPFIYFPFYWHDIHTYTY